ncbi:MAG: NAD(P)-dependent oxidoreductase [Erysipelotrichaceae bacterium]
MDKKKMLLAANLTKDCVELISEYCDIDFEICPENGGSKIFDDQMIEKYAHHEIIVFSLQDVTEKCLKRWKETGLKLLVCTRGTPVNCPWKLVKEMDIPLVYAPGRNAQAVAEMVFGLILALVRNISLASHKIKTGEFAGDYNENYFNIPDRKDVTWNLRDGSRVYSHLPMGLELDSRTIGIVGFGAIGKKVCHIAKNGFGMNVMAYDPFLSYEQIEKEGAIPSDLDSLLANSEFVSIHLPVTPETRNSVDMNWFKKMKPTSYLINTARAAVVNQKDLIDALSQNVISGYAADVCWIEPIPENHPFLKMDNVVLTPHIGAQVVDIPRHQSSIVTSDIIAYCQGKELKNLWKRVE